MSVSSSALFGSAVRVESPRGPVRHAHTIDGSKIVKLQWKPKKSTGAPLVVDVPDVFTQAFVIEKDSKRFPNSGGWEYALFNYEAASDKLTVDPSPSDCGHACHLAVKAKDYIFHPYQKR